MRKLIIEVRANEYADRADGNPNIPYTAEEIAEDAAACRAAGASIVHFHAREPDGAPRHGVEAYRQIAARIRETSDVLLHPTLGFVNNDVCDQDRLAHVVAMAKDGPARADLAPLDVGSINLDRFNHQARRFETTRTVYQNSTATLAYFAETLRAEKVKPYLICWNVAFTRMADAMIASGLIEGVPFLCLCLTEGGYLMGHPATPRGLQSHLDFLPTGRAIEWSVLNYGGNLLPLAGSIIAQGGHISIGVGDYAYPELGRPTNAELVARVADLARAAGRDVATPAEARAMLGL